MFVLIIGGGRTGTQLAYLLLKQNHVVRLIEHRREILANIHRELPTEVIYEGNGADPETLENAGINTCQVLAACTTEDSVNLAICYLARSHYQVPRTIARINNPRNAWLFNDTFHVDVSLNQAEIMASLIEEEMSMGDMMTLVKLRRGQFSLVEEKIPPGALAIGMKIKDMELPVNCIVAAIIRRGEVVIPRGDTVLEQGDEILALSGPDGSERLAQLFLSSLPPPGSNRGLTNPMP